MTDLPPVATLSDALDSFEPTEAERAAALAVEVAAAERAAWADDLAGPTIAQELLTSMLNRE